MKKKVIFIGGATASGKTDISIKMAKKYDGEIISADSRQIYIGMDIGTAKVVMRQDFNTNNFVNTPIYFEGIAHYLIDIVYPNERYTLFDFKRDAYSLIDDILARGKTPIVVGGTGLYIDCLMNNYEIVNSVNEDADLKSELEVEAKEMGKLYMWEKLQKLDSYSAAKIHFNNTYAVIRAIEFAILNNGEAKIQKNKKSNPPFEFELYLTNVERAELYKRIGARIDQQILMGLIEETKYLIEKYGTDLHAISSIGYREIASYLNYECSLEEAVSKFKQHTRNYAKRQLTWFRKYKDAKYIN
jgi:tRNA dimethylallyltransferase